MKSPFPGMDPYLESYWGDVHERLVMYSCDQLQPALPRDLRARVNSRVFVESATEGERHVHPDIHLVERRAPATVGKSGSTGSKAVLAEPLLVDVGDEPMSQSFLEILDVSSGHRIITVIEFLSPTNKSPGEGQDLYLKKQTETRDAGVSLVEVDLTLTGKRVLMLPPHRIPPSHRTTYQACVRRGWKRSTIEVYRIPLGERLPVIPIPLRESDSHERRGRLKAAHKANSDLERIAAAAAGPGPRAAERRPRALVDAGRLR